MSETAAQREATAAQAPASSGAQAPVSLTNVDVEFEIPDRPGETHLAVNNISLDVRPGELLVLVGRSGCGKTTVLNVVAGLIAATRGDVRVMGDPPVEGRKHVSYMFARDALLPWRTARRNVEFALELRRPDIKRRERRARAQELLERLGVGRAANLWPWQLSQGMRQRVALARTWATEPDVLLMDEPFAALDAQTREDVQGIFLDIWSRDRKTAIFVTHDLGEAILLGDRVIVMSDGYKIDEVEIVIPRPRNPATISEEDQYRAVHHRLVAGLVARTGAAGASTDHEAREE